MRTRDAAREIPFTVGLAILVYAAFLTLATIFFDFRGADVNLETLLLGLAFGVVPLAVGLALLARARVGWYGGVLLPLLYLIASLVLRALAAHGVFYDRFYADYTKEYVFCGRDGMQMLAVIAQYAALCLLPAALLLLTPSARRMGVPSSRAAARPQSPAPRRSGG